MSFSYQIFYTHFQNQYNSIQFWYYELCIFFYSLQFLNMLIGLQVVGITYLLKYLFSMHVRVVVGGGGGLRVIDKDQVGLVHVPVVLLVPGYLSVGVLDGLLVNLHDMHGEFLLPGQCLRASCHSALMAWGLLPICCPTKS